MDQCAGSRFRAMKRFMENRKVIELLRRRAQWYRDFAAVGSADARAIRLSLAEHFDRQADAYEHRASSAVEPLALLGSDDR